MASGRSYFYYGTIKRLTAVFSSLFNDIYIRKPTSNGLTVDIKIPVRFAQKQKSRDANKTYPEQEQLQGFQGASVMISYELIDMQYAAERATSQFNQFVKDNNVTYNRSPYDIVFNVYITASKLDDAFQVVEQIVPFFTPSINVKIDEGLFGISNIPIVLNSVGTEIDYEGPVSERRNIMFTLVFTMKAWLYRNQETATLINKTIFNIGDYDTDQLFTTLTEEVTPRTNDKSSDYEIIKTEVNYE